MIKKINIYSNSDSNKFFTQLFPDLLIDFKNISDLFNIKNLNDGGIVFINNIEDLVKINFEKLYQEFLFFSNIPITKDIKKKNITFVKSPIFLGQIKSEIKKYLVNKSTKFKNIELIDRKLINIVNNKSCYLTDIEYEILLYLITAKDCSKEYIKKNILMIKSSLITNSLDSHLTRIRKKLDGLNTEIKIKTNNDNLTIFTN